MKLIARGLATASAVVAMSLSLTPANADSGAEPDDGKGGPEVQACGFYGTTKVGVRQVWYHHCGSGSALVFVDMPWPKKNYYTCFYAGEDRRLPNSANYARSDGDAC